MAFIQVHRPSYNKICFIYPDLGAPTRYRVWHQVEQMKILGLEVITQLDSESWSDNLLTPCNLLYIYRLPWLPTTARLVNQAHRWGLPVVFDLDDYVWDPDLREHCFLDRYHPPQIIAELLTSRDQYRVMMHQVDALVFSTPHLAVLAQAYFDKPIFVNPNVASTELINLSTTAYQQRQIQPLKKEVTLGYFSGQAKVHEADFELILPILLLLMQRYPQTYLKIVGQLELDWAQFGDLRTRIQYLPPVKWTALPAEIASVDINLAPLIANPFTRSKSAVKFLEAALVGVPTVASNLEPYQVIRHGITGMLATTEEQWFNILSKLIESPEDRAKLGNAARSEVLAHHTTTAQAENLSQIIITISNNCPKDRAWMMVKTNAATFLHTSAKIIAGLPRTAYHTALPLKVRLQLRNIRRGIKPVWRR